MQFTMGEYGDYLVYAQARVTKEFSVQSEWNVWAESNTRVEREYPRTFEGSEEFFEYLVSKGLIEQISYTEIHTGSYGESTLEETDH